MAAAGRAGAGSAARAAAGPGGAAPAAGGWGGCGRLPCPPPPPPAPACGTLGCLPRVPEGSSFFSLGRQVCWRTFLFARLPPAGLGLTAVKSPVLPVATPFLYAFGTSSPAGCRQLAQHDCSTGCSAPRGSLSRREAAAGDAAQGMYCHRGHFLGQWRPLLDMGCDTFGVPSCVWANMGQPQAWLNVQSLHIRTLNLSDLHLVFCF